MCRSLLVAIALVIVAIPLTVGASPLELFGAGGRSPGLAGAGVADAEGFPSVYINPAGLALVTQKRLTIGTATTRFRLSVDGQREGVDNGTAVIFGGAVPLPLGGFLKDRLVIGLGFHVPNKALVRVDRPIVSEPTYVLLDNRADSVAVQVAAGFRVSDELSVGAGVLILAALSGKITVTNDASGAFVSQSEQRLETDAAPIVGARYQLSDSLALGATARGPSRSDYNIEVETDLTSIPLGLPEIAIAGNAQYDPGMVALGASYALPHALTLIGDLEYRRWSAFPRPTENPVVTNPPPPEPEFSDTVVPRIALEATRQLGSVRARGRLGYAFIFSPTPEASGETTLLDNHRHVLAVGFGLNIEIGSAPVELNVWSQLHELQGRAHTKETMPTPTPPTPPTIRSNGRVFAGGLTLGVEL